MFRRADWPSHATTQQAIRYLASACDGALRRDGHGFDRDHAALGHWLAALPDTQWTTWHHRWACHLVHLHRRQLARAGFEPDRILTSRPPRRVRRGRVERLTPTWAPDPTGLWVWRWWNGARWTDHVADPHHDPAASSARRG